MYLLNLPRFYYSTAISLDQFQLKQELLQIGPNNVSGITLMLVSGKLEEQATTIF